ncbi:hypothetical protein [Streptomyces sp. NPDC006610]|uniref:hypothetical protein n=1 Tax=Streptomyces sp. NPDC006610 TaxID=3154584 RepID=UPI0033BE1823
MGSDTVMGTAEQRTTPGEDRAARGAARQGADTREHGVETGRSGGAEGQLATEEREPAHRRPAERISAAGGPAARPAGREAARERPRYRPLWVEEPAKRRRLPDPVRTAAVRAVLIISVTLIQAMVAFLTTLAGSWLALPMVLTSIASTVAATWAVLDVWVTRQVWNQRNGVVSTPSSTARALRRERRRARRQARAAERTQERIRRRGGTGQLSHP